MPRFGRADPAQLRFDLEPEPTTAAPGPAIRSTGLVALARLPWPADCIVQLFCTACMGAFSNFTLSTASACPACGSSGLQSLKERFGGER